MSLLHYVKYKLVHYKCSQCSYRSFVLVQVPSNNYGMLFVSKVALI